MLHRCSWNCFLLSIATTAVSGHRRPRGLFCTFMPSFLILCMLQLLQFCDVTLTWSWYKELLQRCEGLNGSSPVTCHSALPWYRRRLGEVEGKGWELQRTVSSPAFCFPFFLTAGLSHFTDFEGSFSFFLLCRGMLPCFLRVMVVLSMDAGCTSWYDFSLTTALQEVVLVNLGN